MCMDESGQNEASEMCDRLIGRLVLEETEDDPSEQAFIDCG